MPKAITYRCRFHSGRIYEITGYPTGVPGLLISQHVQDDPHAGLFNVAHQRSGNLVAYAIPSPEAALDFAQKIAHLCDWTQTAQEVRACIAEDELVRLGEMHGCRVTGNRTHDYLDNGVTA